MWRWLLAALVSGAALFTALSAASWRAGVSEHPAPGVVAIEPRSASTPTATPAPASGLPTSSATPGPKPSPAPGGSEALSPARRTAVGGGPAARVVWFAPNPQHAVFITIDDGWYPSNAVLDYMAAHHLPLTAFVIGRALELYPAFWRAFAAAGGEVEDHTESHPFLTKLSYPGVVAQVRADADAIQRVVGRRPVLFRPPYGAYDLTVLEAARAAGFPTVVTWSATAGSWGLQTYNGGPLVPGEIILLHWVPGLYDELLRVLAAIAAQHLTVGDLLHYVGTAPSAPAVMATPTPPMPVRPSASPEPGPGGTLSPVPSPTATAPAPVLSPTATAPARPSPTSTPARTPPSTPSGTPRRA